MALFVKKAIAVEAAQFNRLGDHPQVYASDKSPTGYAMFTLEHTKTPYEVTPGDWIITGVAGECYPCKDEIFRQSYDPFHEGL